MPRCTGSIGCYTITCKQIAQAVRLYYARSIVHLAYWKINYAFEFLRNFSLRKLSIVSTYPVQMIYDH